MNSCVCNRQPARLLTSCALLLAGLALGAADQDWNAAAGCRWRELPVPTTGKTGFTLLSPEQTGINFTNILKEKTGEANRVLFNGSGVAVGDYDDDGLADIYLCSLNGSNALFKNLGGWRFKDVTKESGIVCTNPFCRGAVFADVNGDGHADLLVATTGGGVLCFMNDGHGRFSEATREAGTTSRFGSVTMALADIDGNGTLDLYVANNRTEDIRDHGEVDIHMVNGRPAIPPWFKDRLLIINGKMSEYGEPDVLYRNDGKGRFSPVPWTDGTFLDEEGRRLTNAQLDWGLSVTFRDMNGDGEPDIYVCNDYWTPDRIWINEGKGHFRAISKLALRNTSASSMGVDFADIGRSGRMDFFVVDMLSRDPRLRKRQMFAQTPMASAIGDIDNRPQVMRNTLFHNRGDGTYEEIANYAFVPASDWSWQPVFMDVDLDGFEDLLITAGHSRDVQDLDAAAQIQARPRLRNGITDSQARLEAFIQQKIDNARFYPRLMMPIVAFHNLGNLQFEETTWRWGTDAPGVHHAIALADFDGDGDLDLVVNNLGTAAGVYRNETAAPRVAVRLKGHAPNTQGIGATIKLLGGAVPVQSQEVVCGGRYMAGSDPILVFAAGNLTNEMRIEVRWRSGKRSVVAAVKANRIYEIDEAGAEADSSLKPKAQSSREWPSSSDQPRKEAWPHGALRPSTTNHQPLFEDVSQLLNHTHHEEEFNDFERQPLLPKKLSQLGPGVAWGDLDGDGWDDLVIGSGKGGRLAVFRNDGRGAFRPLSGAPVDAVVTRDQTSLLIWPKPGKGAVVLSGLANYEDGLAEGSCVREYDLTITDVVAALESSVGPLALGDMVGDGTLELFVGGRVIGGRYPEAAASRIYRWTGKEFQMDEENSRDLSGLVSGAVWSDLNGDGKPELVLACDWGPVRIFKNEHGKLVAWDAPVTLNHQHSTISQLTGWWNAVTTGDIDGDGELDIIASNWGLNSSYQPSPEHPIYLYYGDFAERGTVDLVEAEFDPLGKCIAPRRMRAAVSMALPDLPGRFPTHKEFSEASIDVVLGLQRSKAHELRVNTLASMLFLNRVNHFDAVPLPPEAQFAPAFSVNVADFDGDGHEDVFLSQNFFATQPETPRLDAGRGLLLLGDGTGRLRVAPGEESGIKVYGEQRGAAFCDYDGDGRIDLVVTQNGAETRLYHNSGAKPGLRVRLQGPPGNPTGVGAQMRLLSGPWKGPVREVHAGSGYWSQDSAVQVLGSPGSPTQIWIRWPGGKVTTSAIPEKAGDISIDLAGKLEVIRTSER